MQTVRDAASAANRAGICVVPAKEDGSKRPDLPHWTELQKRRPTNAELNAWFPKEPDRNGLFFILGRVSGNVECIEFDDRGALVAFKMAAEALDLGPLIRRVELGYAEETPSGGAHWLYRVSEPRGNTKLASKPCTGCEKHEPGQTHVLIETRGEGGGIVAAPSHGPVHPSGRPYILRAGGVDSIAELTLEEREELWQLARTLDEMPRSVPVQELLHATGTGDRPGDRFNQEKHWADVLEPAGWRHVYTRGDESYWRRPGKNEGVSATTNYKGSGLLYVFSSSVPDFVPEEGYNKFRAYALLHHGGDFQAAARAVDGYDPGPIAPTSVPLPVPAEPERPAATPSEGYSFRHIFPPGHFVTAWVEHCARRVDAAYEYHEAVALVALAQASAGIKPVLSAWPKGLRTNLYVLIVGDSTVSRKSTAINFGRMLLEEAIGDYELPDAGSPEGWVEQIAKRPGQPTLWAVDEFGQMLEDLERKPASQGLRKVLLEVYDGKDHRHQRVDKRVRGETKLQADSIHVRDPYVSVLGGTTEDVLQALSTRDIASGLLPRFAYVWPESRPAFMPIKRVERSWEDEFHQVASRLAHLRAWVQDGGQIDYSDEAMDLLNAAGLELDREGARHKIIARLGAMCWKVAMLATLGEYQEEPPRSVLLVGAQQARWAIEVVHRWRADALRFGLQVGGDTAEERHFNQKCERVLEWLSGHGGTAQRRVVARALNLSKRHADEVEQTLNDQGRMGWLDEKNETGRPSRIWALT